ncbi:MAG: diguanylate cyclase [Planctomycetaceae bacterium]|nr:diguanylate cyclase [Planctomycetaceae bacterium]
MILPTAVILVVLTIILTVYIFTMFLSYSKALIKERVAINTNSLKFHIENGKKNSQIAALSVADHRNVVKVIKGRNREEILRVLAPMVELHLVDHFTITDENGIVLARTHAPDSFGDSLVSQRNIREAMEGKTSTYFETGTVAKVAIRTGAPVYAADGTMIGVVSAGIRYDTNEAVDLLKEKLHSEVTIFFGDSRIVTTVTDKEGRRITETKMDPAAAKAVLDERSEYYGTANIFSVEYKTYYMPLLNANDEVFAVFCVGTPLSEIQTEAKGLIRNIIIISLIGLIAAIVVLHSVISTISEPIIRLSREMDDIADGNLNVVIDVKNNNDEVGHAGKSLQKVVNIVHKLIDGINDAISEHEKGNTDYRFDTNAFHGDYRLLADRIMRLSSLGMEDPLTGIPNRRSFDSRLNLEWHRAMREKMPISILILDVDEFKAYNDTYGHQQGDVVLQTVADALMVPLKRGFDFAARWGGEEFVVLLPNTDSAGALCVAEMIRREVGKREIPCVRGGTTKNVTVSIGVNTQIPSPKLSIANLVAQADGALYQAKKAGRNRVCLHSIDLTASKY